jgi:hypothetical protein
MCATFQFRVGMEFSSLKQFKVAILEHSVLNGKHVKFVKNDVTQVRVVCKKKCKFLAFVSRVGKSTTFKMKTLNNKHTCGRVYRNKSAKSTWVAKMIVDKLRVNNKMKLTEIMEDMRLNCATGITKSTTLKAREIALEVVDGDVAKQYTLL